MGSRRVVGAFAVIAGLAMVLGSLVAPSPVAATDGYVLGLHNQTAEAGKDCPDSVNDYWHFIIAPNSGTYAFVSITLNVGGTSYTFTGAQIIPNGSQMDNVFVAVPAGKSLGDLLISGSSATISPTPAEDADPKFNLSHTCDGSGTTTTTSTSTTSTSTTSTSTTSTSTTSTTSTTTTTTLPDEPITLTPVPYCNEVDVEGNITKEWYDVTNNTDGPLTVEWADGSKLIASGATAHISTAGPGIELTVGEEVVGSSDGTKVTCHTTVRFTKNVAPERFGGTYTIRVSRLVGPNYLEETTFDIAAGESQSIDLPSTGDASDAGFTYTIEEIADGGASVHTINPSDITLAGHLGETVSVVITNSFAAISLDKQVSATNVLPGDQLSYTLIAHNIGALDLESVVITDLLPIDVTYSGFSIVDNAGSCVLTVATQPQLVTCSMNGVLPVDGYTKAITLTVTVDADIPLDSTILNQARVVGSFVSPVLDQVESFRPRSLEAVVSDLSCIPVPEGTVCDLSAKVGSTVDTPATTTSTTTSTTELAVEAPTTTTTVVSNVPTTEPKLPVTGNQGSGEMLMLGLLVMGLGSVVLLLSRRPARS